MGLWKMGVAAFIPNNSFKFGKRIYGYFSSAYTSGTSINYDSDYGNDEGFDDHLVKFLKAGDKILLGPSTHSNNPGATEYVKVSSLTSTVITIATAATYDYADNDPITGIGTKCPDLWVPDDSSYLDMGGITEHILRTITGGFGYQDRFSVQFGNDSNDSTVHITHSLNMDDFLSGVYYRAGCYYQFSPADGTDNSEIDIKVSVDDTNILNYAIEDSLTNVWTAYNSSAFVTPNACNNSFKIIFGIKNEKGAGSQGIANIDCVYLEHAGNTDDELSGVYTFDDYCDFGSRSFDTIRGTSVYRLDNYKMMINDSTYLKDASKKYIISCKFTDVDKTIRENLEVLLNWQKRGKYLVLHHDIPSIPNNLQGFMSINETSLSHYSSDRCSFSINFEEA